MAVLAFHGQLPAAPTDTHRVSLELRVYATAAGGKPLWAERQRAVMLHPGGVLRLILGSVRPLPVDLFDRFPRWLEVQPDGAEPGPRVALLGSEIRLEARIAALEAGRPGGALSARVDQLEGLLHRQASATRRLRDGFDHLHDQVTGLREDPLLGQLRVELEALSARLDALTADRLQRIEDELEDLVGPDGDVVDLDARLDALHAAVAAALPALRRAGRAAPRSPPDPGPSRD